jgi:hypothetical protein
MVAGGREDPLPAPFPVGPRILHSQGIREGHSSETCHQISLVLSVRPDQVNAQGVRAGLGDHGPAILAALTVTDVKRELVQVDILHPELERFEQAQTAPVQQGDDERWHAFKALQHGAGLGSGQDDGQAIG